MIQHVNPLSNALPLALDEDFSIWSEIEEEGDEPEDCAEMDASLDFLVKHALKTESSHLDTDHAWQRLSRRVQGPFGAAALEAPDFSSIEAELLSSGGRVQQAPFVLNDRIEEQKRRTEQRSAVDCLWSMLRPTASGTPYGVRAWMLG